MSAINLAAGGRAQAIVPAIGERAPEPLAAALAAPEARDAARILRQWGDQGAHVAAACSARARSLTSKPCVSSVLCICC